MRQAALLGLGLALVFALDAAASNPYQETRRPNSADMAAARAATVEAGDLRPARGWHGGQVKVDFSNPGCPNYHPKLSQFVSTGAAATDWDRGAVYVGTQTDVLKTARMVRRQWQIQVLDPRAIPCMRDILKKQLAAQGITLVSMKRMPFPQLATYSRAYKAVLRAGGQTMTMEQVVVGRSRTEINLNVLGTPPAEALRLARILVGRIRA